MWMLDMCEGRSQFFGVAEVAWQGAEIVICKAGK